MSNEEAEKNKVIYGIYKGLAQQIWRFDGDYVDMILPHGDAEGRISFTWRLGYVGAENCQTFHLDTSSPWSEILKLEAAMMEVRDQFTVAAFAAKARFGQMLKLTAMVNELARLHPDGAQVDLVEETGGQFALRGRVPEIVGGDEYWVHTGMADEQFEFEVQQIAKVCERLRLERNQVRP